MGILMIIFGFGALLFFILSMEGSKRKGYPKKSWLRYDLKKVRRYSCLALACLWGFCIFAALFDGEFTLAFGLLGPILKYPIVVLLLLLWNIYLPRLQKKEQEELKQQEKSEALASLRTVQAAEASETNE